MKIPQNKYDKVIIALDGIRCDNRENKQYDNAVRQIDDDIMQYIERKGYCKYIYGANCRFVRTLTEKGYNVLQYMDYGKYRRNEVIENWRLWSPIGISVIAILISCYGAWIKPNVEIDKQSKKLEQLGLSLDSLKIAGSLRCLPKTPLKTN